jgi:hypothetical protein
MELITPEPAERSPELIAQIDWLIDFIDRWDAALNPNTNRRIAR